MAFSDDGDVKQGTVLEIQRMSTEDGPGIRTTVFFKGCSLKCSWCHNPESIQPDAQIHWLAVRCIGCHTCLEVCPRGALSFDPESGVCIDRRLCRGCGTCAEACPSTALELLGQKWTVADLVDEVNKDRAYFEKSGGGITASGGEALLQADFVTDFLKACRKIGLSTAIDTCGQYPSRVLEQVLPWADLVLFDLKEIDPEKHRRFTGIPNTRILENLRLVRDFIKSHPYPRELWIRTPIIPGATADKENIRGIGRWIADNMNHMVGRWELCAFNNLCRDKYTRLGLDWEFKDTELMTAQEMEAILGAARESGVRPDIVHWTGATRIENLENEVDPAGQPITRPSESTAIGDRL